MINISTLLGYVVAFVMTFYSTQVALAEPTKEFLFVGNVSAYTAGVESTGKRQGDYGYGLTASGERVRKGIVAADTKILPFGTRIHIEGYGDFVVKDTGGSVKGNCIDIYMEDYDEAIKFGRRNLKVYVYKE